MTPKRQRQLELAEFDLLSILKGEYYVQNIRGYDLEGEHFLVHLEWLLNAVFATYIQHRQGATKTEVEKFWNEWNAKTQIEKVDFLTNEVTRNNLTALVANKSQGGKNSKRKKGKAFDLFRKAVMERKIDITKSWSEQQKIKLKELNISIGKTAYYDYKKEVIENRPR